MKTRLFPALLAVVSLSIACSSARAERLEAETVEIGGNVMYDFDTAFGSRLDLGLMGGYYVAYGWLVGGEFQMQDDDYTSLYGLTATVERSFEIGSPDAPTPFIPYVGAGLGFASSSFEGSDDASALLISVKTGLKMMLTGDLAVDAGLYLNFATDDVYYDDDGPCKTDISIRIGLRTFLF